MTLKGHYALRFKTHASFGAHHENLNEDRSILSATWIKQMTLFMAIFCLCGYSCGLPGVGASYDSGVIENADFQGFRTLRLGTLGNEANIII